jgi:hypothetical protein
MLLRVPSVIALRRINCSLGARTVAATILLAIFVSVFVAIFLALMSGQNWRAEQDKARGRRIADARMNARLLRLNI